MLTEHRCECGKVHVWSCIHFTDSVAANLVKHGINLIVIVHLQLTKAALTRSRELRERNGKTNGEKSGQRQQQEEMLELHLRASSWG